MTEPAGLPGAAEPAGERDASGRFRPGNITSRKGGNPSLKSLARMQAAVRRAGTPEDLAQVLGALKTAALAGDAQAGRVWLERVLGPASKRTIAQLTLPPLNGPQDVATAMRAIVAAASEGRVGLEEASELLGLVGGVADAVVLAELEQRVAMCERRRREGGDQ